MNPVSLPEAEKERRLAGLRSRLYVRPNMGVPKVERRNVAFWLFLAVLIIAPFGLRFYLGGFEGWDPMLWYSNWRFVEVWLSVRFIELIALPLVLIQVSIGATIAVMRKTPLPAIVAVYVSCGLILSSSGGARWTANLWEMTRAECFAPGSYECVLNDFHRMYDIGWDRDMTPEETQAFGGYVALRERAKLDAPKDRSLSTLAWHQSSLRKWEERFTPELLQVLHHFPQTEARGHVLDRYEWGG